MSQKELQRVSVIGACIKGELACARLPIPMCEHAPSETLEETYARRGGGCSTPTAAGPVHVAWYATRRADCAVGTRNLRLDFCEEMVEREGFSLSRECLRRLLRKNGVGSPQSAQPPLIASAACVLHGSANSCNSTAVLTTGLKDAAPGSPLLACRTMRPEKSWPRSSSPRRPLSAISTCFARCSPSACRLPSTAITAAFVRNDDGWTVDEQLAGKRQPTQFGRALEQLGVTFIAANSPQAKGRVYVFGVCSKIVLPVNYGLPKPWTSTPPTPCCASSSPTTTIALPASLAKWKPPGVWLQTASTASAASCTQTYTVGNDNVVQWEGPVASESRAGAPLQLRRSQSADLSGTRLASSLIMATPVWSTHLYQGGETSMLPLG